MRGEYAVTEYDFSAPVYREKSWKWENESRVDGHRVLPMSVADTDFVSPREVTETLRELVEGGEFGYCAYPADHREVFAAWQARQHGWELEPQHVVIANGLLSSLVLMLDAVSAAGDGVILFTPVYQNFFSVISAAGRVPVCCDLVCGAGNDWTLDLSTYQALCQRDDTRAVVICNPHNPIGRAWSAEELRAIVRMAQANDLVVFSDEIHADFVYDQPFNPAIKVADDPRGIMTLTSGGKTFNIGGLFVSYAIAEDDRLQSLLQQALARLHWHQDRFGAWGSYTAYKYCYRYRDEVVAYIRRMQVKMVDGLNDMPFPVNAGLPGATFLLWADFRATGWSQDEIQHFLVADAGLGFNRGDSFGASGSGFARINCAVPESRIDEALRRLHDAFARRLGD